MALELGDDVFDGLLDAALHQHRVDAGNDGLEAFVIDRFGQHGRGGGAVAGHVGRLGGDFADHAGAHVLVLVFELDFASHGHAVLGDGRRAERLLDDDVTALGAEGHLDRAGQFGHAAAHRLAGFGIESNLFGAHLSDLSG